LVKYHKRGSVVCSTRIEPPLHPPGPEKIVKDFGMWPEDFDNKKFNEYVWYLSQNAPKITKGIFAPWLIDRRDHLGHDDIFKSVFEDTDLFRRFILSGYNIVQSWESLVYHLTCRGGQFLGAEKIEDFQKKDDLWLKNNRISMLEYIRKWGGYPIDVSPCEPKPNIKYNIAYVVKHANMQAVEALEPWCDRLYIDDDLIIDSYREKEQSNTNFDLTKRVLTIEYNDPKAENDIVIEFDAKDLNQESFAILQQFPQIIEQSGDIGEMELHPFKLSIFSMNSYEKDMIQPIKNIREYKN
jgi:hypothetical protein